MPDTGPAGGGIHADHAGTPAGCFALPSPPPPAPPAGLAGCAGFALGFAGGFVGYGMIAMRSLGRVSLAEMCAHESSGTLTLQIAVPS